MIRIEQLSKVKTAIGLITEVMKAREADLSPEGSRHSERARHALLAVEDGLLKELGIRAPGLQRTTTSQEQR